MSISDVPKVGGLTFTESHWEKQGRKAGPTKNMIMPSGRHAMEDTSLINVKGQQPYVGGNATLIAVRRTITSSQKSS